MRNCISILYMDALNSPPSKDWGGVNGTLSGIQTNLNMRKGQHQRIINVVAKTHHALITGKEYESMRNFRMGSKSIKIKERWERGLGYTKTTLFFNRD